MEKRSIKRSVGALDSCASSTRRTTRAIVLSADAAVTLIRRTASPFTVPAKTVSSTALRTGTLSPVTGASSIELSPATMTPSAEIRSPGRTSMIEPTARVSAGTSRVSPPSSNNAVLGTSAVRDLMLSRAFPAATPSSSSPTRKRKTTAAASSVASMTSAPAAAIVISISMENGVPASAAMIALRAIGTRPTSIAIV